METRFFETNPVYLRIASMLFYPYFLSQSLFPEKVRRIGIPLYQIVRFCSIRHHGTKGRDQMHIDKY